MAKAAQGERGRSFAGVRVLVTGHTGFKGGWLCEWLLADGAKLAGLALAPEAGRPSLFEDLGLADRMASSFTDIRDMEATEAAIRRFEPEIVFHLAAQPLVRRSYADPLGTFAVNVMGTAHVLEAARRTPSVRAVVCVTSDKCYDNKEQVWGYRETDPLGGKDPYSASKGAAEIVAGSYARSLYPLDNRIRLATARGGNVVGGGDWSEDRLVPDLVRAMEAGRPLVIRNPGAIRPWQHVLELVRGYVVLGGRLLDEGEAFEGGWNFGPRPENEVTVSELIGRFSKEWPGVKGFEVKVEPSHLKEAQFLKLDIAKAGALLDWRPHFGFDDTAKLTVDWYRGRFEKPADALRLTQAQLGAYRAATGFA